MTIIQTKGALTRTLYSSFGGPKTNRKRLEQVPAVRLWDIVFNRRAEGNFSRNPVLNRTLTALQAAGLEDPFEERPEIKGYVRNLFKRYQPRTAKEKAKLFVRAVIPSLYSFEIDGKCYNGLTIKEGGLAISPNVDYDQPIRKKHGRVLPKQLIGMSPEIREGSCLEYSLLLTNFLRAAGMAAYCKAFLDHIYTIAILDGEKYRIDAGKLMFVSETDNADPDREVIASYYFNKAVAFGNHDNFNKAIEMLGIAEELDPTNAAIWCVKGRLFEKRGEVDEALVFFDAATRLDPNMIEAWEDKGNLLQTQEKWSEASEAYETWLKLTPKAEEPAFRPGVYNQKELKEMEERMLAEDKYKRIERNCANAWFQSGVVFCRSREWEKAIKAYDRSLELAPDFSGAWYNKGLILEEGQGKLEEALSAYEEAIRIDPKCSAAEEKIVGILFDLGRLDGEEK